MKHSLTTRLVLALVATSAPVAQAGVYVAPSARWVSFAARPEGSESTPNYYGIGPSLSFGYSFAQVIDLGAYAAYTPARLKDVALGADDAVLTFYAGELAFRISETIYFGLRGGKAFYELNDAHREDEVPGKWSGPAGGFSLGAIHKLSRQSFLQTSLDVMHTVVQSDDDGDGDGDDAEGEDTSSGKRRFDAFGVSLGYVFNGDGGGNRFENTILGDFIDALTFF